MSEKLPRKFKNWKRVKGATTQPKEFVWISNGKSRFGGERKSVLVKEDVWKNRKKN